MCIEQNDQMVCVDPQSGYDKFKSNFCVGCTQIYTLMVNRTNTRKSQGTALSGLLSERAKPKSRVAFVHFFTLSKMPLD